MAAATRPATTWSGSVVCCSLVRMKVLRRRTGGNATSCWCRPRDRAWRGASRDWISGPWANVHRRLQELLDQFVTDQRTLAVLDAGCGSSSAFSLPSSARRSGIDISARQLERNVELHERIVGDVQEHVLPAGRFNVVLCWDVLEHLRDPQRALDNLVQSLAPGGLLVIGLPNVLSPRVS